MNQYTPLPPYFGYLGSKRTMVEGVLKPRLHPLAFRSRVEVFAGGLSLELALPPAKVQAIVNDLDGDIVGTHEAVATIPNEVMRELSRFQTSRRMFNRMRDLRDNAAWHELTDAKRAAAIIYLSQCSVNSNMRAFSVSSTRRSGFNPQLDLSPYSKRLRGITFEDVHYEDLLNRLVFKPREVHLFGFLDPPYVIADSRKHYRLNFDRVEHLRLARLLARVNELNDGEARDVKLMLTYDDDPDGFIRSLYRPEFGWRIDAVPVAYEAENRAGRSRTELVIMNYKPIPLSPLAESDVAPAACNSAEVQEGGNT